MSRRVSFSGVALALLAFACTANAATITSITPNVGGVNGQTRVSILGTGFDIRGRSNDVFIGTGLQGVFCDPIPNECTDTRIVCLTDAFQGGNALPLSVRSFGFLASCQISTGCTFRYSTDATPEVTSIFPEWTVAEGVITVTGTGFSQGDVTVGNFDFTTHLGEEERGELVGSVSSTAYQFVVHAMRPGTLPVDIVMGASGRATLSGQRSIMLFPQITAVAPALGSIAGGTQLTLTGTSFSPELMENDVRVYGRPCVVTDVQQDQLYCTTAAHVPTTTPARTWQPGVYKMETWYGVPGNYIDTGIAGRLQVFQPSKTQYVTGNFDLNGMTCTNCAVRLTTHFVAPATGTYIFGATGDDEFELWLGTNEDPVQRVQQTPANSAKVLDITPFNSARLAQGYYNTVGAQSAVNLTAGNKYWMRGWLKQGQGAIGYAVTVIAPNGTSLNIRSNIAFSEDWVPPVTLTVRGAPAIFVSPVTPSPYSHQLAPSAAQSACTTWGNCAFNYDVSATPTVTGVTGSATPGSIITITGTGFDTSSTNPGTTCPTSTTCGGGGCACPDANSCALFDDLCTWNVATGACGFITAPACSSWSKNIVTIGGASCLVQSQTATQLTCMIGYTAGAGTFPVLVQAGTAGAAAGAPLVTVTSSVRKIVPTAGSVNGGNVLTIIGAGFDATPGVTNVTIGGSACAIQSISSFAIKCLLPSGTAGAAALAITTASRVAFTDDEAYIYTTPITRPGTTVAAGAATVTPLVSSLGGGTQLTIYAPTVDIATTSTTTVLYGGIPCDVAFALGHTVTCYTRGYATSGVVSGRLTVAFEDGTVTNVTLPSITFTRSITAVDRPSASPMGSNLFTVSFDGYTVRKSDLSFGVFGQSCLESSISGNSISCLIDTPPTTAVKLPVIDTLSFTGDGNPLTDPLNMMDYTAGVSANIDGTVTIPAGSNWLMSRKQYTRPFSFKAMVQATKDITFNNGNGVQVVMRACVTENARSADGYRGIVADTSSGFFAVASSSSKVRSATAQGLGALANVRLDPSSYHEYKLMAYNRYVQFYIDGVLIATIEDPSERTGSVGFGFSGQPIRVKAFTIEDLTPQVLQVNVSGVPVASQYDVIWGTAPTVTSILPRTISTGTPVTIQGSNWGGWPYSVYALNSESDIITSATPKLCDASTNYNSVTGATYLTCTAGSVPQGTPYLAVRTGSGRADTDFQVTYKASVTSVSPVFSGAGGKVITLSGAGFTSGATVTVGGSACVVKSLTVNNIVCFAPSGSGTASIAVSFTDGSSAYMCSACNLLYNMSAPAVTAITPTSGGQGTTITITGTGFETSQVTVFVGTTTCNVWSATATTLRCTLGRSATAGAGAVFVHFGRAGFGTFATGVSNSFTVQAQATGVTPSSGSVNGGTNLQVYASNLDLSAGTTSAASFTFATSIEKGWSNAPTKTWTCNSNPMMGPFTTERVSKQFTSLATHVALRVNYDMTLVSSNANIIVDGVSFSVPATSCSLGWVCGSSWMTTCRATGSFIIPHTSASALVSFTGAQTSGSWGVISYKLETIASWQQSVTVGGNACPITLIEPNNIYCSTPAGSGSSAAVAVVVGGATYCSGCTFNYASTSTPTVTAGVAMELPGLPADNTKIPQLALFYGARATYSSTGVRVWKENTGDGWNGGASSPQMISAPTVGVQGISFITKTSTCNQMYGLSSTHVDETGNYASINFALYLLPDSSVQVYELGSYIGTFSNYLVGDSFSVYYDAACSCVKYSQNGVPIYVSGSLPQFPLYMAGSLYSSSCAGIDQLQYLTARPQTSRIVFTGTGITTSPGAILVNNIACTDYYVSINTASCWLPSVPTSAVSVIVNGGSGVGSSTSITLTTNVASAADYTSGSSAGGHIVTILGTGFTAASVATIGATCNIISQTANQIVCETSSNAAGQQVVKITTGSTTHTCFPSLALANTDSSLTACTYTYSASTPAATAVSGTTSSGQIITVTGTGFVTGSSVKLGSYACTTLSFSSTSIACTITNIPAGAYTVRVVSPSFGASSSSLTANVPLTVSSVSSTTTGDGGAARITISGANFGTDAQATVAVTAGSTGICASIVRTPTSVVCTTSAGAFSGALTLAIGAQTTQAAASFTAASSNAPTVASVVPTSGGAGTVITVTGTNLAGPGSLFVGGVECAVISSTATTASCMISAGVAAGAQTVTARTDNAGTATGSAAFTVRLFVSDVKPFRGPNAGGQSITVYGSGFSTNAALMNVWIAGAPCTVTSVTVGAVSCITGQVPTNNNATSVAVSVTDFSNPIATANITATYTYNTSLTATVTSITPAAGSAAGLETVTIVGTGFSIDATQNVVTIGGSTCAVSSVSADGTTIICLTQPMAINTAAVVSVNINGAGRASGSVTFSATLNVNAVSPSTVSLEGGAVITLSGSGFWTFADSSAWQYTYYNVTVGGRACTIVSSTPTALTCTVPAAPRAFNQLAPLVSAYPQRPEALNKAVVVTANGVSAVVVATAVVSYKASATPMVTSVSPMGTVTAGTQLTISGTGFATTGNTVWIGSGNCPVVSESATQVVCKVANGFLGAGFVTVSVPGAGYSSASLSCPTGQYLMCDGSCLSNSQCVYQEWGMYTCQDLDHLIIGDTFCHSNGGTDRVGIPFRTDSKTVFNLNCPMYSCEGGDCDQALYIGGRGGRVSTCGPDPSGYTVTVRPVVSALSTATSSIGGGVVLTVTGLSFGVNASAVTVLANGAVCAVTSIVDTSIVCETSAQVNSVGYVTVYVNGVSSTCTSCSFTYSDANIPTVTSTSPSFVLYNTSLTIIGTNFGTSSSAATVWVGSRLCPIVSLTATQIVCTAPQQSAGTYSLTVKISPIGNSFGATVNYRLGIRSLSASAGSTAGSHTVTITGSGFSSNTVANFGGCPATTVGVVSDRLVVTTNNCSGTQTVSLVDGSLKSVCESSCPQYRFNPALTPQITQSNINGNTVTLSTANLGTAPQSAVSVTAGTAVCAITSYSATSITCTMGTHSAGTYPIQILVSTQGLGPAYTDAVQPTFQFTSTVTAISPNTGSLGGGQSVTITGTGFGTTSTDVAVKIGTDSCNIVSVADTSIVCTTVQTSQSGAVSVSVQSVASGMLAPVAAATLASAYTYDANSPKILSIVPNRGSTAGGTSLTIGGSSLSTSLVISIDGVTCAQSAAQQAATTSSLYFCTTAPHPTNLLAVNPKAAIPNNGGVAWTSATYQYIDLWSRWTTWGNTPPPVEGDSAVISTGQAVMIDYSPPRFFLIVVMGHLLFDPTIDINLDCTYIMINYGRFTVGTPQQPYLKRAVITLHGDRLTPEIPVHGSKVIALRHGALDMHGKPRQQTWTKLSATAPAGAAFIKVAGPIDWAVGEFIAIATTSYEFLETEQRMITGVSPADGQAAEVTLQLEYPLDYGHYGQRQCFGANNNICIDEIAEVALLSRNILVRGDRDSMRIGFGGTMFLMPLGQTEDMYARLSFVEFAQVGQQFIVGRYPVHFHVTYGANTSYVNGTSVHESLNRAFSIHGISNNTYVNNVAVDIQGHAFFIEDGSEKYNTIDHNMVAIVKSTTSNLNTDVTPANFWIVSPTNKLTRNAACGGHAYGYWISPFHPHSTGPTASTSVCPASHPLWQFSDNTAHSNRKYGFRIFQFWWPKAVECDFNSADVPAYLRNLVAYKNQIHGITMGHDEVGSVGAIIVDNYTAADNGWIHKDASNYWIEHNAAANMTCGLQNSNLIALSNNDPFHRDLKRRGVNLPLGDNFFTENVTFVNYNSENYGFEPQAWAERMSLCFPWGWEAVSRGLAWVNSPNRVLMRFNHHGVLNDDDGTLTGTAGSQLISKSTLFDDTICRTVAASGGYFTTALVCPNNYKVRRFGISTMNEIWTWQNWSTNGRWELVPEIDRMYLMTAPINRTITIDFQWWKNPAQWDWKYGAFIFLQKGERQGFTTVYNETRDHVYAKFNTKALNKTWWGRTPDLWDSVSSYTFENKTTYNFTSVLVYPEATGMTVTAYNCPDAGCPLPPLPPPSWEKNCTSFHNTSSWTNKTVPWFNSALYIKSGEALCLDAGTAVKTSRRSTTFNATQSGQVFFSGVCTAGREYIYDFFSLRIEGSLQLYDHHCPCVGAIVTLRIQSNVWIRNGGLLVGNDTHPLTRCQFRLSLIMPPLRDGQAMSAYTIYPWSPRSIAVESGMLSLHGKLPQPLWARLAAEARAGATSITLDQAVDWAVGSDIAIAGTNRRIMYTQVTEADDSAEQSEKRVITAVSSDGRTITLNRALTFGHYGSGAKTLGGQQYNVGAEVIVLNRQITLDGGVAPLTPDPAFNFGWALNVGCTAGVHEGCAVGTSGAVGWPMGIGKPGYLQVDGVRFNDIGQAAEQHGAVEIDGLNDQVDAGTSYFRNNAFDRVFNTGIFIRDTTTNMRIVNNTFFNVSGDAIRAASSGNVIDGNVVVRLNIPIQICDAVYFIFWDCRPGGVRAHSGNIVTNNIIASGPGAGFVTEGDRCTPGSWQWSGNMAHSTRDGLLVATTVAETFYYWAVDNTSPTTCRQVGGVTAYWIADHGFVSWYAAGDLQVNDFTVVEATIGMAPMLFYGDASAVGLKIPTATFTNIRAAGFWDGQSCRSSDYFWDCKKSLLDSAPWCKLFHRGFNQQKMGTVGISEAIFTSNEFGPGRTKGEQKFRWTEMDSYSTIGGQAKFNGVYFRNFDGNDGCGLKNVAFHQNPYSNDTFHHHEFSNVTWESGIQNGGEFFARRTYGDTRTMADSFTPTWYMDYDNFKFGAYWPDSPNHVLIKDIDGSFTKTGKRSSVVANEGFTRLTPFSKLGYNGRAFSSGQLGAVIPGCTWQAAWSAYICDKTRNWTTIIIDNLDEDRLTRRPGPVVLCKGDGMQDVNGWPLCQGGQVDYASGPVMKGKEQRATEERMTRWWFHAENGGNYTLSFRGMPPTNMRIYLQDWEYLGIPSSQVGVTLNLRYFGLNSAMRVGVYVNSVRQRPVVGYGYPWEMTPALTWPAPTDPAGTHYHDRYVNAQVVDSLGNQGFQRNVLSFSVRPSVTLDLIQEPIVQVSATLSVPVDEFFNNPQTFVAALASTLGIDSSRIKFASIVPGTTRRRAGGSTNIKVDVDQTGTTSSDLVAVARQVNTIANTSNPIPGQAVTKLSAVVLQVVVPTPALNVRWGTPYVGVNISGTTFNSTTVQGLLVNYLVNTIGKAYGDPYNTSSTDNVAVTNVWSDTTLGKTRFVILVFYDNSTYAQQALIMINSVLNGSRFADVLPGVPVTDSFFNNNGWAPEGPDTPAGPDMWSTDGSIFKFAVGAAAGLVVVFIIGGSLLYYFISVRPSRLAAKMDAKEKELEGIHAHSPQEGAAAEDEVEPFPENDEGTANGFDYDKSDHANPIAKENRFNRTV